MRNFKKIVGIILLIIGLLAASLVFFLTRGLEEGKSLAIGKVDIENLADGNYMGSYSEGRWDNQVEVTVVEGEITEIQLIEGFEREEVKEKIYQRVIKEQSLTIDVVSGATVSSNAYLKAIENALQGK